jgi:transposase
VDVLKWLKKRVACVHPEIANTWVLHHNNAPSRASLLVREFLAKQTVAMLPQPPYSPDLAPPDFFLFPWLKSSLKGHNFGTVKSVQAAVTNALKEIPVQVFQVSYNAWQNCWQQCIDAKVCYFEEY